jgi:hypothetical protein
VPQDSGISGEEYEYAEGSAVVLPDLSLADFAALFGLAGTVVGGVLVGALMVGAAPLAIAAAGVGAGISIASAATTAGAAATGEITWEEAAPGITLGVFGVFAGLGVVGSIGKAGAFVVEDGVATLISMGNLGASRVLLNNDGSLVYLGEALGQAGLSEMFSVLSLRASDWSEPR